MGSGSLQQHVERIKSACLSWWGFFPCVLFLSHFLFINWTPADPDLFARMAMGKLILESGTIPTIDPFAWTPRLEKWIDHEWLSGVVFYVLHSYGGDWALYLFKLLMVAATATALRACYCINRPFSGIGAFAVALTIFASSFLWFSTVRCQVFTYLFLAFALYAIESHRLKGKRLPLVASTIIMPLWTNLHGGFVLGLIVAGAYAGASLIGKNSNRIFPLLCLLLMCALTFLNPYGIEYWAFIVTALSKPRPMIAEWSAVNPLSLQGSVITLMAAVTAWSLWREKRQFPLSSFLILAFSFYSGFKHARLIPLALMSALALIPNGIEDLFSLMKGGINALSIHIILWGFTLFLLFPATGSFARYMGSGDTFSLNYSTYPVEAVAWMKKNVPPGKILNPFDQGSYILWDAYPHLFVSVDGRYEEVYPEVTFAKNLAVYQRENPKRKEEILKSEADYILMPTRFELTNEERGNTWEKIYSDSDWIVYGRSGHALRKTPIS